MRPTALLASTGTGTDALLQNKILEASIFLLLDWHLLASTGTGPFLRFIKRFPRGEMCNSDSSLGSVSDFFFPHVGANSNNVWLSPDERYLFVANNTSFAVTTLNYTEDPPNLTFGWPL